MSQDFNIKFDQYKENDPTKLVDENQEKYPASLYARDLCIVMQDGKMMAFNYSYLISKECSVDGSQITLMYTSHIVTLKGKNLKPLFFEMLLQIPRIIRCSSDRYNVLKEAEEIIINEIFTIEK